MHYNQNAGRGSWAARNILFHNLGDISMDVHLTAIGRATSLCVVHFHTCAL